MTVADTAPRALSEEAFAAHVDALAADPARRNQLTGLLRENHPIYDGRGTATVVRMRGWILLALARAGLSEATLIFVLEELDTGLDPYLVAAAARALRSYPQPNETLAPFVARALKQIRYHDEPVSLERYGEYATAPSGPSAVSELLATIAWLGPHARPALPELEELRAQRGLSRKLRLEFDRMLNAIRGPARTPPCCGGEAPPGGSIVLHAPELRRDLGPAESVVLQDHGGRSVTFGEFFRGQPSIVVFFYTRCDNALKCSLTIAKLAKLQTLLEAKGGAGRIRTAAITYDPAFDLPERLRIYGKDRGVRMDRDHRMLRAVENNHALRAHFELGVNFIESLVNRHRVELYILDARGRVAVSFERIHWDEQEVVGRATELLNEQAYCGRMAGAG